MTNLIDYANNVITKYPQLKSDITSLIDLCIMEIEEGSPEAHEMSLCWSDIEALIKEEDAKILTRNL